MNLASVRDQTSYRNIFLLNCLSNATGLGRDRTVYDRMVPEYYQAC